MLADIGYMACRYLPVSRIAKESLEENVEKNEAILQIRDEVCTKRG
jgi:hypothetical protein